MLLSINTWGGTLAIVEQLANSLQFYLIHLTGCLHNLILTPVVATFAAVVVIVVVPGPPASASLVVAVCSTLRSPVLVLFHQLETLVHFLLNQAVCRLPLSTIAVSKREEALLESQSLTFLLDDVQSFCVVKGWGILRGPCTILVQELL